MWSDVGGFIAAEAVKTFGHQMVFVNLCVYVGITCLDSVNNGWSVNAMAEAQIQEITFPKRLLITYKCRCFCTPKDSILTIQF